MCSVYLPNTVARTTMNRPPTFKTQSLMSDPAQRFISMPPTAKFPQGHQLPLKDRVLVVIGANGSGKTRFGAWLDSQNIDLHHRVSAHRSLVFPERVKPTDIKEAELMLFTGHIKKENPGHYRQYQRWQNQPEIALLNDFEPLVTLLVSESFVVKDKYHTDVQTAKAFIEPPKTRLGMVKEIWEMVLPARELVIAGTRIETRNRQDKTPYHSKEMSDGERGAFYLIAEALSVPKDGVFIVDEPELHLHRAIQARLWDAIEAARPDCTFVYITHDLGFAASRKDGKKVWLREYNGKAWDWEEVPESDELPEPLLLEMMGSRRPVLFVEGDSGSLDLFIYGKVFQGHTVIPCGSCEHVIHSTRSFTKLAGLHHNTCGGLVDSDGRSASDIQMLQRFGIEVLPVALVENLFLIEPILQIAAKRLGHDPSQMIPTVKDRVLDILRRNSSRTISNLTRQEIDAALRTFGAGGDGAAALTAAFTQTCSSINPAAIYAKWEAEINRVLTDKDYPAALRYYKTKGLPSEAGNVLGVKFVEQVMRWLRGTDSSDLVDAFRAALPAIPPAAP
jgi:ABC-type oligopeptide transport system ATPase subunit